MKIATLLLALVATTAQAEFVSGNDLQRWFNDKDLEVAAIGYVAGAADTLHTIVHCRPNGVTVTQVVEITKQYMRMNPEKLHFSGDSLVTQSLKALWPCPKQPSRGERQL